MGRHTWPAAICVTTLALGAAVMAQQPATLVLRSSERVSGELVDMGADFTMRVGGDDRHVAIADVVLIDFVGGGSGLPTTELNAIPSSGHLTVLRQGQESFIGRLIDIGGNPMQLVFSTDQGERRVEASRIGRVYLGRPAEATAASNAAAEPPVGNRKTIVVQGNVQWIDTGLDVTRGQVVTFSGSGEIQLSRRFQRQSRHRRVAVGTAPGPGADCVRPRGCPDRPDRGGPCLRDRQPDEPGDVGIGFAVPRNQRLERARQYRKLHGDRGLVTQRSAATACRVPGIRRSA